MKYSQRLFFMIASFMCWTQLVFSQSTVLEGIIEEDGSHGAVAFAHIFLKSMQVGTTTDTTGYFKLNIIDLHKTDTLIISCLGYQTVRIAVAPGVTKKIEVELKAQFTQLKELVITAGENPAWAILNKVVENKRKNNPEARKTYSCEEY